MGDTQPGTLPFPKNFRTVQHSSREELSAIQHKSEQTAVISLTVKRHLTALARIRAHVSDSE